MTNFIDSISQIKDWDSTPRLLPKELQPKAERAQGQTPVVEGHILNKASDIEAAAEALAALTTQIEPAVQA